MIDISKLSKPELKVLLKKVKLLSSLKKSLWKRWFCEYSRITNWQNSYKFEYFDFNGTNLSYFEEKSLEWFNKLFWLNLKKEDIEFIPSKDLKWWFRIFLNDNMFDFSYQRFEKILK